MKGVEISWVGPLIVGLTLVSIGFLFNDSIPLAVVYGLMGAGAVLSFLGVFRASELLRRAPR